MTKQNTQQKPVLYLNASALKIAACSRKLYLTVIEGWRSRSFANDIEFGSA